MAHLLRVVLYGKQCLQTDIVWFLLLQMYAFILIVWQRQEVSCLSVSLFELNFVRLWSFWIQARVAALDICTEIFKTGLLLIFGETGTQWSVELRLHSLQSYKVHSFILTSKVDVTEKTNISMFLNFHQLAEQKHLWRVQSVIITH